MALMENAGALFDAPPPAEQERMVEAILFASAEPLSLAQIGARLPHGPAAGAASASLLREPSRRLRKVLLWYSGRWT